MSERQVKIVFNGATGDLARRFHLPGLVAIRDEGGLPLSGGDRAMPDVILVGRNEDKLKVVSAETGFKRWSTNLDEVLTLPEVDFVFDAAPTGMRLGVVRKAIAARKHIYVEKPIALTLDDALAISREASAAGLKNGTVQDKLYLPGYATLLRLRREGFFGQLLETRIEMGRWIFDGDQKPAQRATWNYRAKDGGGMILDMFPHWRYMLEGLAGEMKSVSAVAKTQIPHRRDEAGKPFDVDVDDAAFAWFELEGGGIASLNSSWATRMHREFPIQIHMDGTGGSAVAGPFGCYVQRADEAPSGPLKTFLPPTEDFFEGWTQVSMPEGYTGSYRAGWELFIRHIVEDAPFPYKLIEGAKGLQLVEAALQSSRERRWVELPALKN